MNPERDLKMNPELDPKINEAFTRACRVIERHIIASFGTITGATEYVNAGHEERAKRLVVVASEMDRTFWVVTPRHAKILFAAGYTEALIARKNSKSARRNRTSRTGSWIA